jgi:hypothetical protein
VPGMAQLEERRSPIAALLILIALFAGAVPGGAASPTVRDSMARLGSIRGTAAATVARPADLTSDEQAQASAGPVLTPSPPAILAAAGFSRPLLPPPGFASANLQSRGAAPYQARAPPAT